MVKRGVIFASLQLVFDSACRGHGCVLMALEQLTVMWYISREVCTYEARLVGNMNG